MEMVHPRIAPQARDFQCSKCGEFLFDEQVKVDMPSSDELAAIRDTRGRFRRRASIDCFDKYHERQIDDTTFERCGPVEQIVCYR